MGNEKVGFEELGHDRTERSGNQSDWIKRGYHQWSLLYMSRVSPLSHPHKNLLLKSIYDSFSMRLSSKIVDGSRGSGVGGRRTWTLVTEVLHISKAQVSNIKKWRIIRIMEEKKNCGISK